MKLYEAIQLTHLEHIEDLPITDGVDGIKASIQFLKDNVEILKGHGNAEVFRKVDGSPSLVFGINPENGKYFVATKSLFNKVPKINYTPEDIDANHESGVKNTLKIALEYLPLLGEKGIIQGDVLFTSEMVKTEIIDNVKYTTFRPNTITYAVPYDSALAKTIRQAKIGVAWHTTYHGTKIENISASFKIDIKHKKHVNVYSTTTKLPVSTEAMFSPKEYEEIMSKISEVESEASKFKESDFGIITKYKIDILAYINSFVRKGENVSSGMVRGLFDYIETKYQKAIDSVKTDKSKEAKKAEMESIKSEIRSIAGTLWFVFLYHQKIQDIKTLIIRKLDSIKTLDTFVLTSDGYKVTTPEGYVVVDKLTGGAVKLVDRLEFSQMNFNIIKTWS